MDMQELDQEGWESEDEGGCGEEDGSDGGDLHVDSDLVVVCKLNESRQSKQSDGRLNE